MIVLTTSSGPWLSFCSRQQTQPLGQGQKLTQLPQEAEELPQGQVAPLQEEQPLQKTSFSQQSIPVVFPPFLSLFFSIGTGSWPPELWQEYFLMRIGWRWLPYPGQRLGGRRACHPPGARSGLSAARCPGPGARRRLVLRAGSATAPPGEAAGRGRGPRRGRRLAREAGRARGGGRRGSARGGGGLAGGRRPAVQVLEKRSGWRGCAVQPSPFRQRVEVVVLAVVLAGRLRLRVLGAAARGAVQRLHGRGPGREQQLGLLVV